MNIQECLEQAFGPNIKDQIDRWDDLEAAIQDGALGPVLRENIIGYRSIIRGSRYSINDYVCACRFATMTTSGVSNQAAFEAIFPERAARLRSVSNANLSQGVHAYKNSQLVRQLLEQFRVPLHILFQDKRIDALNTLHELMGDDEVHPRDRVAAASALATHLAPPKETVQKVEIVDNRVESTINALKQAISSMSSKQIIDIEDGTTTVKDVGQKRLVQYDE